ncbi:hypothetical protein ADK35_37725 [Streptomyces viridochromogenes]|nr:hypothetical protein ADK35_37725 [Streptomyces viridochromogenes]KOG18597.1 hypothetical protein ADK36_21550 [Streptomyces viridochromogenes]
MGRDLGYVVFRMSADQAWHLRHLAQPFCNFLLAPPFEWGIALYDLEPDAVVPNPVADRDCRADAPWGDPPGSRTRPPRAGRRGVRTGRSAAAVLPAEATGSVTGRR